MCQPGREEILMVLLLRESSVYTGEFLCQHNLKRKALGKQGK